MRAGGRLESLSGGRSSQGLTGSGIARRDQLQKESSSASDYDYGDCGIFTAVPCDLPFQTLSVGCLYSIMGGALLQPPHFYLRSQGSISSLVVAVCLLAPFTVGASLMVESHAHRLRWHLPDARCLLLMRSLL